MKVYFWFNWQIGFMLTFGVRYDKRPYVCIDIPFLIIQICGFKIK